MKSKEAMIGINVTQAHYYDQISEAEDRKAGSGHANNSSANIITRFWGGMRARQRRAVKESGVEDAKIAFHRKWVEQKRGGDFLEIGCFRGNSFTLSMIESSRSYVGLELSAKAAEAFGSKIRAAGLDKKGQVRAMDFLKLEEDTKFDLIYASGVLHHFENPGPLFEKIAALLRPDGILIFTEPSNKNLLLRLARAAYRPLQSDKAWEWPFCNRTIRTLETYLVPLEGFGWGKHSLLASVFVGLPVIHPIVFPIYKHLAGAELAAGWSADVWNNSSVTAVCKLRNSSPIPDNNSNQALTTS